jgi:hypothetical protein
MMEYQTRTRLLKMLPILALTAALLAGCSSGTQPTPTPAPAGNDEGYVSANLDTSYEAALSVSGQLALGTLQLEESVDAVRADQASALLPLWQALRSDALQSQEEVSAVLKQIEGTMSREQLEAIAAMRLTLDDMRTWAENRGLGLAFGEGQGPRGEGGQLSPEARATRQAQFGGQGPDPEALATMRAQFGGQEPDPEALATMRAQFGNMSDEQRQALRATAEAGGGGFGGRGGMSRFFGGAGQARVFFGPLIELLTERAAS